MVNTEQNPEGKITQLHYNILNIVVNTEQDDDLKKSVDNYNILNIVVNTEHSLFTIK